MKLVSEELALEKAKSEQVAITAASLANIKMPDLSVAIDNVLAPIPRIAEAINTVAIDATEALNDALANMAVGFGEFFAELASGIQGSKTLARWSLWSLPTWL